jgi:hypothetical protein
MTNTVYNTFAPRGGFSYALTGDNAPPYCGAASGSSMTAGPNSSRPSETTGRSTRQPRCSERVSPTRDRVSAVSSPLPSPTSHHRGTFRTMPSGHSASNARYRLKWCSTSAMSEPAASP